MRQEQGLRSDILVILVGYLVLGLLCGVLWHALVHPAMYTKVKAGGVMGEFELGKRFAADGWYVVVAVVAGLVSGLATSWRRSRDPLATAVLVFLGSVIAAAAMAWFGRLLGPGDPKTALAHAPLHAQVPTQLTVSAHVAYLAWPMAALLGTLMVLLSAPFERSAEKDPEAGLDEGTQDGPA